MRCYECGNEYIEQSGYLKLHNKTIGYYEILLEKFYKCSGCGSLLFPDESARIIAEKEEEIKTGLIRKLPVGDFIIATEAAKILGITKQAFHKHRRIKKGFIYSFVLAGKRLYNKKSVLLFKEKNDGRFNLSKQQPAKVVKYIRVNTSMSPVSTNLTFQVDDKTDKSPWSSANKGIAEKDNNRYIR